VNLERVPVTLVGTNPSNLCTIVLPIEAPAGSESCGTGYPNVEKNCTIRRMSSIVVD
jgi:hypothetical protein